MPWFDLPEADLRRYRTSTTEPGDLDGWWRDRLDKARGAAREPLLTRHSAQAYGPVEAYDVEFSGDRGDRIRGWYLRPAGAGRRELATVVSFIGYGGGRGVPEAHLALPAIGLCVFVMDSRGQGGRGSAGATGDAGRSGDGAEYPGVTTRGIASPDSYYFSRLFIDAARAVEVAADLDGVDRTRIAAVGASQGGGLALAAAALQPELVTVCQADTPFLCDLQRAIGLSPAHPYQEIASFLGVHDDLVPAALNTLRYIDCALLARRIAATTLIGVGLMDEICPPSTVFAAYNEIGTTSQTAVQKEIAVYPFGTHALPDSHAERRLVHLREHLLGQG